MHSLIRIIFIFFIASTSFGQEEATKTASINFHSEIGGINATNSTVISKLNTLNGSLFFSANIEGFIFKNSLMQKHYNEADMMNSELFPKATFKGNIINNKTVNYKKDGIYPVKVKGTLMIKGVKKTIETNGKITVKNGKIAANAIFSIDRHDYNVEGNEESVSQILKLTVIANY